MESQALDFYVPNRKCFDYGSRCICSLTGRIESAGQKSMPIPTRLIEWQGIRNRSEREARTQLDQRPAYAQVESVTSTSGDCDSTSEMVAGDDGAQPRTFTDNGGNMGTASRRGTNVDDRRICGTNSESFAVAFSEDLHLFAGLYGGFLRTLGGKELLGGIYFRR